MFELLKVDDRAQGLPEYALLVAIIVVMVAAVMYYLYPEIVATLFTDIGSYITDSPQAQGVR